MRGRHASRLHAITVLLQVKAWSRYAYRGVIQNRCLLCLCLLIVVVVFAGIDGGNSVYGDVVFGLKSRAVPTQLSGTPTHVFAFEEDGTSFNDYGVLTLGGQAIDADGLALSRNDGLVAFLIEGSGSTLISIQANDATASTVGSLLPGREIRGAVFDRSERLWAVDAANNELLQIDPASGQIVGSAVQLTPNVSNNRGLFTSDIAVRQDGTFVLSVFDVPTDSTDFYQLNPTNGDLTLLGTNGPRTGLAGLAFSRQNPDRLFGYEQQQQDDLVFFDTNSGFNRNELFNNIIPGFNSGGGDLANLTVVPEPSAFSLFGVVSLAFFVVRRRRNS